MCIIMYKPKGVKLPSWEVLENCFENNPDGAGFSYNDGRRAHIQKGFFDFESLKSALLKIEDLENRDLVVHCRISTSGLVDGGNCHPYAITDYRATEITTKLAIAHNGIFREYNPPKGEKVMNDTQIFIENFIKPLYRLRKQFYKFEDVKPILEKEISGSRLALMDRNSVDLFGNWVEDYGCYFSNSSYSYKKFQYNYNGQQNWHFAPVYDYEKSYEDDYLYDFDALDELYMLAKDGNYEEALPYLKIWGDELKTNDYKSWLENKGYKLKNVKIYDCMDFMVAVDKKNKKIEIVDFC